MGLVEGFQGTELGWKDARSKVQGIIYPIDLRRLEAGINVPTSWMLVCLGGRRRKAGE